MTTASRTAGCCIESALHLAWGPPSPLHKHGHCQEDDGNTGARYVDAGHTCAKGG